MDNGQEKLRFTVVLWLNVYNPHSKTFDEYGRICLAETLEYSDTMKITVCGSSYYTDKTVMIHGDAIARYEILPVSEFYNPRSEYDFIHLLEHTVIHQTRVLYPA